MTTLTAEQIDDIARRHPDAFRQSLLRRFAYPLGILGLALYTVYVWWFFSIGAVLTNGHWDIAGAYLADWVSYEARPEVDYETGDIKVTFPKYSPLGSDPHPDWLEETPGKVTVTITRPDADAGAAATNTGGAAANSFMSPSSPATSTGDGGVANSFMSPSSSATSMGASTGSASGETTTVTEVRDGTAKVDVKISGTSHVEIVPGAVVVTRGGQSVTLKTDPENNRVEAPATLPDWISQRKPGSKVYAYFGFAGRVEIRADVTKVSKRFLGWENFWFDTNSPYWGKTFPQVMALAFSGDRIEPGRSNLAVMWDNIVNNAEWQHGDVWIKLLQTIVMAFVGTLFAVTLAFPLSFLAARNITPNPILNQILKRFFDFQRSVDMLIWALFFTRAFGPGPLAGISAIFFTDTGTFGKLYSELLENIDDKQREGVRSVGASPAAVQRFGVVPQVLPVFISQALYFWESNTRSATIIGAVGAGGIGLKLWEAMRTNQDWENVAYMVILILIVVFVFDNISNALRSRLTEPAAQD